MNKKLIITLIILAVLAILAFIYFSIVRAPNINFDLTFDCNDTLVVKYNEPNDIIIHIKKRCGDFTIETKTRNGVWEPLKTRRRMNGETGEFTVYFDTNTMIMLSVQKNDSVRFICNGTQGGQCRVESRKMKNDNSNVGANHHTVSFDSTLRCGNKARINVYNFSRQPMHVKIEWLTVCKDANGNAVMPELYRKANNMAEPDDRKLDNAVAGNKGKYRTDRTFALPGNSELFMMCTGSRDSCLYRVHATGFN